ncbi:MAG TPA: MBL fold metallo-hydrolase [Candidatus Kapabacteria bacterium]|nr:MBL fold metallo-hydrolase [Candidatus Kapabacteria bacterium]
MLIKPIHSKDGTGTISYLLIDEPTKKAAIIDANREDVTQILDEISKLRLELTTIVDTHTHADHVSGAKQLREVSGGSVIMHTNAKEKYKFVDLGDAFGIGDILRENVKVTIDRFVNDGDSITFGDSSLKVLYAPGHTDDHICLLGDGRVFTGDLLLIGQAGRSDLPSGNTEEQYDTLFNKIMKLPPETIIHPGHDYEGRDSTTLEAEKKSNPFLALRSKPEYVEFVKEFFPPMADSENGTLILQCGTQRVATEQEGFTNITAAELKRLIPTVNDLVILDVRQPMELLAFGAIEGAVNVPVGDLLYGKQSIESLKQKPVVVVCQTGGRSIEAAHYLSTHGCKTVYNLAGGTLGWMREGYRVKHSLKSETLK